MIFVIYILAWEFSATSATMLIIPTLLVLMRASYLDRRTFLMWYPLFFSSLIFLYLVQISKLPLEDAALQAGTVLSSSILLIHHAIGLLKDGPSYTGAKVGTWLLLTQRCMVLEKKLILNSLYSFRVRVRSLKSNSMGDFLSYSWSSLQGIILTVTLELLRLVDEIERLYRSRGSNPVSRGWVIPVARKVPILVGDVMIVIIISVLTTVTPTTLVPRFMQELIRGLV